MFIDHNHMRRKSFDSVFFAVQTANGRQRWTLTLTLTEDAKKDGTQALVASEVFVAGTQDLNGTRWRS